MNDKPLGQVAFEAHDARLEGATGYDWAYEPPLLREAWQAAAEAVIGSVDARPDVAFTRGFKKGREETEARYRAVIEAAKAFVQGYDFDQCEWKDGTIVALDEAVEALEEVEHE